MKETKKQERNNQDFILIISTVNNIGEAEKLAALLVKERAAACVSFSSPVTSVYRWRENVEVEREVMLFIKTIYGNYKKVEELILENHIYEVPEIICLPIINGHEKYLDWVTDNTISHD